MVLPFENTSNRAEYNWVGESFADALAELLNKPGLVVVSSAERELAYHQLRLPETVIPSRATAIKLARQAKASIIVIGSYSVTPACDRRCQNRQQRREAAYRRIRAGDFTCDQGE